MVGEGASRARSDRRFGRRDTVKTAARSLGLVLILCAVILGVIQTAKQWYTHDVITPLDFKLDLIHRMGTAICGNPANGSTMLFCSDWGTTGVLDTQNWTPENELMANPYSVAGLPGKNSGCATSANISVSVDSGLDLACTTYDGGACTCNFDAGQGITPVAYSSQIWSRFKISPPFTIEASVFIPSTPGTCTDGGNCADISIFLVAANGCFPNLFNNPPVDVWAANWPPIGTCSEGGVLPSEIDVFEQYGVTFYHSYYWSSTTIQNPVTYTGYDAWHTIAEVYTPNQGTVLYYDGSPINTISTPTYSGDHFIMLVNRAVLGFQGRTDFRVRYIRGCTPSPTGPSITCSP